MRFIFTFLGTKADAVEAVWANKYGLSAPFAHKFYPVPDRAVFA
jgi:hypothetical protein